MYYLDSCIWLNLFKRESGRLPFYKLALCFINQNFNSIVFSGLILKELKYVINNKVLFDEKEKFLKKHFSFMKLTNKDYDIARKFELEHEFKLSFYDYLHISVCLNNNYTLITRDIEMIKFAKKYILVYKPEEIINY